MAAKNRCGADLKTFNATPVRIVSSRRYWRRRYCNFWFSRLRQEYGAPAQLLRGKAGLTGMAASGAKRSFSD